MKSSDKALREGLKSDIAKRIKGKTAIVAIGNILRGDDGLGTKLIELLKARNLAASLFDCGTAPENYIFPILSTSCDTVILIDAADLKASPGTISVLDLEKISNVSFSTHSPSPRLFTDLLNTGKEDMNIFVICIQPKSTLLGDSVSGEVMVSLNMLSDVFGEVLG